MIWTIISISIFIAIVVFILIIIQPKNFAKALRVSQTCSLAALPSSIKKQTIFNCNVYTLHPDKEKRIIFFPGGAFIRCCIDFKPFTETSLQGYEIVMIQYRTLLQIPKMQAAVEDCSKVLGVLLSQPKKTLVIGYSAGAYMAAKSIENLKTNVEFLGLHGYYNETTDYLLKFYSWLYLAGQIRLPYYDKLKTITGSSDPLEESTLMFNDKFGIFNDIIPNANHFTFYDLKKNQPYIDRINTMMQNL